MKFQDHFSGHADSYATYRPHYPDELISWLASRCREHECAWDCATGNGQAARLLRRHFATVIATDASQRQIAAAATPGIDFRVASAEASGLAARSVDLLTVAQALHWFDIPGFFAEAQRVLKANGVLAVWSYDYCAVEPDVDHVLHDIFAEVEDFWPPERAIVVSRYRDIELPAAEMAVPGFTMSVRWSVEQMLGYLRTWSATQRYLQTHATDPIGVHEAALRQAWGDATLQVSWPLTVRVCRVAAQ